MSSITQEYKDKFLLGKGFSLEASNVGELKQILELLPDDFNIEQGFSKGVAVTIYNIKSDNPILDFDDAVYLDEE